MTPFPVTQRLVEDRILQLRGVAERRGLTRGRVRRPAPAPSAVEER